MAIVTFFWVVVVRIGCGLLDHETLKFAVYQDWIDEMSWFFLHFDTNLGWAWSKMGENF